MRIGKKLLITAIVNVLAAICVASIGLYSVSTLSRDQSEILLYSEAMNNHLSGDMMHDALRADVLSALLVSSLDSDILGKKEDVLGEVNDHAENFLSAVKANSKLQLGSAAKSALAQVEPKLIAYIDQAKK